VQRQQSGNGKESFQYRLYGLVVHGGRSLEYGHYTACVRMRTVDVNTARTFLQTKFLDRQKMMTKEQLINLVANDVHAREHVESPSHHHGHDVSEDQWFDISDASVFQLDKKSVLQKEAYLLFYERVA